MPWPKNPNILTKRVPRVDGMLKATGKIKYPSDVRPEGTLFGVVLYCPHASATIKSLDASDAEKMPGVKAIHIFSGPGSRLRYQGEDIAAVAAETEEQARDAVRAIKIEFDVLPHAVTEAQAMRDDAPAVRGGGRNYNPPRARDRGDVDAAIKNAAATVKGVYSVPVITHVCLESHGLTAQVKEDKIMAWASTQSVEAVEGAMANHFKIPASEVVVLTEVMGGGFGSKFGPDSWGIAAGELSKKAGGRPVRVFLDRTQEHLAGGNRPSATAEITLAGDKDGKVTAIIAQGFGTSGNGGGGGPNVPYVYDVPNARTGAGGVATNCGGARAMRAPNHPQNCTLTEAAFDDLAEALGVDPLELRLKNLKAEDPLDGGKLNRSDIYRDQIKIGAELIDWKKNYRPRSVNAKAKGPIKRGVGMGLHQWGGGGAAGKEVACEINPDGSVEIRSATQDIGTGIRTILAMIAAEVLGLKVEDVTSKVGNSTYPPGQGSGGSTTTPSMAPPAFEAANKAKDQLFAKIAKAYATEPEKLSLKDGALWVGDEKKDDWKGACRKLGMSKISVTTSARLGNGMSSTGVGGAQFATVAVDVETGEVRVEKIVAVQDSGLILDLMTWESQVSGGVIGGLNPALFEERVMDEGSGVMLNADMEMYKLARAGDMPEIIVKAYDTPEMRDRGVIGIGEPPTISTMAAIGNAVSNAIGVRVPVWPMTPMNVLNALAAKKGEA